MSSLGWPQTTAAEHVFDHEPLEIAEPQEPQFPVFLNAAQKKKLKMQQARQEREKLRKRQEAEEMESAEREMEARRRERVEKEWAELQREKAMLAETTTVDHDSPKCPTPPAEDASSSPIRAPSPSLPLPPPFTTVRAELICQVHLEILNGGSFSDTNIHLYSRRNRAGASYAPRVLALNRRILEAASPEFEEYVFADTAPVNSDAYLGDSDLEDDEADDSDLPGSLTVTSLPDSFDYQEPETPKTEEDITTRLGDADLLTDDEFESHPRASGTSTPARRSQAGRASPDQPRILDGAFKTWQAMSLFLYTDRIQFNPIRSQASASALVFTSANPAQSLCSPKSMYRLAERLGLPELKEQAQASLKSCLTESNIVDELFSDFTWRYPDILRMETEVFYQHSTDPSVTSAMRRVFARIAKGELAHSDVVLEVLFGKLTEHLMPPRPPARA